MLDNQQIDIKNSLEYLLTLPAKKRLDAIFDHDDPAALVGAMHPQDILLAIREIGAEDALELLELLPPSHIQELFDLEIWDNDELNPHKAGHYFSLLFEANHDRAVEQLDGLDIELVGLMFKMVAEIYDTTLGEEPMDFFEICSQSPDGRFLVCFADSHTTKGLSQALHLYLESLYARDMKKALSLLENVRFEVASGLEQSSLKWRSYRLLDMGVLPREERLEYFSTITLGALAKKQSSSPYQIDMPVGATRLPMQIFSKNINSGFVFLRHAIAGCLPHERQRFFESLTHASLNMHASWSGDFGDRDEMVRSVEYVKTLCEFGLAQAALGQIDEAAQILRGHGIKPMVRLGRTALVNLRKLLVTTDASFLFGEDFCWADTPLREMARALKLAEPRFYEGLLDAGKLNVRFFSSLSELNVTLRAVHELRFRALLVGPRVLGITGDMLQNYKNLAHATMYARYMLNSYLKNPEPLAAIDHDQRQLVLAASGGLNPNFEAFAKEFSANLAPKLAAHGDFDHAKAQELCGNFLSTVLIQLEQNHELLLG